MQIDVRATERLRAKTPVDLGGILSSVIGAVRDSDIDLTRLRIACDWVQYRQNFRNVVDLRNIIPNALQARDGVDVYELAIDMRRAGSSENLTELTAKALNRMDTVTSGAQFLEDWTPGSQSVIWDFNSLYWGSLGHWEAATGQEYEQALPGGESDARNSAMAREMIEGLFDVWDQLSARKALPDDLYVLELGVGNGNQAKVWLDEFVKIEQERKTDYYRRLHYLMADYSAHVVERARQTVKEHAPRCSSLVMDARVPTQTLGFLRSKAFLIYISNVYDNLPTDEIVRIGGQTYLVEVRAYIDGAQAKEIADSVGITGRGAGFADEATAPAGAGASVSGGDRALPRRRQRHGRLLAESLGRDADGGALRRVRLRPRHLPDRQRHSRRGPATDPQRHRRRAHAGEQRRGSQLPRFPAAAAPVRHPAVLRHLCNGCVHV